MTTIDNIQDQPSEIEEIKQTNEHSNGSDIEATDAPKSKRRNKKTDQDQLNNNDSKSIAEEINSSEQAQAKEINSSEQAQERGSYGAGRCHLTGEAGDGEWL